MCRKGMLLAFQKSKIRYLAESVSKLGSKNYHVAIYKDQATKVSSRNGCVNRQEGHDCCRAFWYNTCKIKSHCLVKVLRIQVAASVKVLNLSSALDYNHRSMELTTFWSSPPEHMNWSFGDTATWSQANSSNKCCSREMFIYPHVSMIPSHDSKMTIVLL
jgi:hypothetical protein